MDDRASVTVAVSKPTNSSPAVSKNYIVWPFCLFFDPRNNS